MMIFYLVYFFYFTFSPPISFSLCFPISPSLLFFLMFFLTLPSSTVEKLSYACNACSVAQLCPTLCDPVDCSPPGSSVHGILQARVLDWAAMPSSRSASRPRDRTCICLLRWQADSLSLNHLGSSVVGML